MADFLFAHMMPTGRQLLAFLLYTGLCGAFLAVPFRHEMTDIWVYFNTIFLITLTLTTYVWQLE